MKTTNPEHVALQRELREGRDPFERSFSAGVSDAIHARLYRSSFLGFNHHSATDYDRGWEYGRDAKLGGR